MIKFRLVLWILCFFSSLTTSAFAASQASWKIVPAESELRFTATQNGAPVSGQFKTFTGEIFVDPEQYQNSKINIIVDINSLSASYGDLKTTLETPDWFNSAKFPKAEFKATEFKKTGDNSYQALGTLTIRDKQAPVTLTFTTQQPAPNKGIVTGSTIIKRSTFGVGQGDWASTDEVKDDVTVNFKVTAIKQ